MKNAPDLMVKKPRPVVSLELVMKVLQESVSVEGHTNGVDEDCVDPGNPFVNGMVAKLPGTNGKKPADSSQHSGLFGKLVVDERGDWPQGIKPGSLNVVHIM